LVAGIREELKLVNDPESTTQRASDEDWSDSDALLEDLEEA
jgi:hypothetical protein